MFNNIVIGKPIVDHRLLIALDEEDWEAIEKEHTMFTETRYLPAVLKEAGVVPSTSEVRRNKPELNITLNELDCIWVKWGKHRIFIVVGA